MNRIKVLKSAAASLLLLLAVFAAAPVFAGPPTSGLLKGVVCAGTADQTISGQNYKSAPACGLCDFILVFINASNLIIALSGALAVLIFVYAGIMYLTASFKPDNVAKAKAAINATVIGLAFIFGGYTIINFVILTFIGGTANMSVLSGITSSVSGQSGWGVCSGYDAATNK